MAARDPALPLPGTAVVGQAVLNDHFPQRHCSQAARDPVPETLI
jgi:hypothetical protein